MRLLLIFLLFLTLNTPVNAQTNRFERSKQTITSNGHSYYLHKVARNQTLSAIAVAYGVTEESIIEKNPFIANGLKPKQSILIPTQETFKKSSQKVKKEIEKQHRQDSLALEVQQRKKELNDSIIANQPLRTGLTRQFRKDSTITVVIVLPFSKLSNRNIPYNDFFRGTLLALNELKKQGISTYVKLISCRESSDNESGSLSQSAVEIVRSGILSDANLIIGPVHATEFITIAEYATQNRIPIVSPLAAIDDIESPFVFQVTPCEQTKYDKLKPILKNPSANVIVFKSIRDDDADALAEIAPYLPSTATTIDVSTTASELAPLMRSDRENIIVVPVTNETLVASVLSRIQNVQNPSRQITVIGSAKWARFSSIEMDKLFLLNTIYTANYHEDRTNNVMLNFYQQYVSNFGSIPTMLSMRGYDVTMIFVEALAKFGSRMPLEVKKMSSNPLQVKYNFTQDSPTDSFLNREWTLVNYHQSFQILVR